MPVAYAFEIDSYEFPRADTPARGPVIYAAPQRWAEYNPIGTTANDASILTFLGLTSQRWDFVSRADTTTKDKLLAVFNARASVNFKTPQDAVGFNVLMRTLEIQHLEPIEDGKFLCRFTLVRRS